MGKFALDIVAKRRSAPAEAARNPSALLNDVVCPNCGLTLLKIPPNVEVVPSEGTIFKCGSCGKEIDFR